MPTGEHANSIQAEETAADPSIFSKSKFDKIDVPKVIDIFISRQTQYYTLWGVYTVVQFTAGSFGYSRPLVGPWLALAVLIGVWIFNFGHLGFVLTCVDQLDKLSYGLNAAFRGDKNKYESSTLSAFKDMQVAILPWKLWTRSRSFLMNSAVHLSIDICASIALLIRVDYTCAKLSWRSQFDDSTLGRGVSLLGGEMKASNTPTIRPPFPRRRHQFPCIARSTFKFPFLLRFARRIAAFNSPPKMKMEAIM
jgi:hypothetical protein